jgi:hypothetical protein
MFGNETSLKVELGQSFSLAQNSMRLKAAKGRRGVDTTCIFGEGLSRNPGVLNEMHSLHLSTNLNDRSRLTRMRQLT